MAINFELSNVNWLRYVFIRDTGHLDYIHKSNKCDDFYLGFQWSPEIKAKLDIERRPALTINKILATISNVEGDQIQTRAETTFKPLHVSGEDLSTELAVLFKQIAGHQMLAWKESEVFADGVITSRGFFDVRLSFARNTQGEIEIIVPNPRNILIDPDGDEYDPDTWKETIETKWAAPNDIEVLYNKEDADYLRLNSTNPYIADIDSVQRSFERFGGMGHYPAYNQVARDLVRNIRIISRQYKKITKAKFFVDTQTGDQRPIPEEWDHNRISTVVDKFRLGVLERVIERIRWTTTAGPCVLHDAWSPYKHFTQVPFFPYFRRGRTMGLVENLLDPQELLNKVTSQELHIVNTTANSGWIVKQGNLVGGMSTEELEQRGAQSGVILEVQDIAQIEKIQPNQVPTGIDRISYKAEEHIKTISNVDDNALGQDREDVSSKAIKAKRQRGSVNQLKVMDNFSYTRQLLARNILDIMQEYYTEPRIYRVVYGNPLVQAAQGASPDENEFIKLNQYDAATDQILKDLTLGEYDVVITSMPASDTIEESEFEQCMAMKEAGIMIPDDVIVAHSLLREKRELVQRITAAANDPEAQQQKQLALQGQQVAIGKMAAETDNIKAHALDRTASAQSKVAEIRTAAPEQAGGAAGGGTDLLSQVAQNHHDAASQAADQMHEKQMQDQQQQHETATAAAQQQHEAMMTAAEQSHEAGMADKEHKQGLEMEQKTSKHAAEQQKATTAGAIKVAKAKPVPKPAVKGKK
jgi:hypothetical protein